MSSGLIAQALMGLFLICSPFTLILLIGWLVWYGFKVEWKHLPVHVLPLIVFPLCCLFVKDFHWLHPALITGLALMILTTAFAVRTAVRAYREQYGPLAGDKIFWFLWFYLLFLLNSFVAGMLIIWVPTVPEKLQTGAFL